MKFRNQSCILFPPGLSLLYMVASVNPTLSQVVYRVPRTPYDQRVPLSEEGPYREFFRARVNDFLLSLHNPVIYLDEPLIKHRIHNQMHTITAEKYMMNVKEKMHFVNKLFGVCIGNLAIILEYPGDFGIAYATTHALINVFILLSLFFL